MTYREPADMPPEPEPAPEETYEQKKERGAREHARRARLKRLAGIALLVLVYAGATLIAYVKGELRSWLEITGLCAACGVAVLGIGLIITANDS